MQPAQNVAIFNLPKGVAPLVDLPEDAMGIAQIALATELNRPEAVHTYKYRGCEQGPGEWTYQEVSCRLSIVITQLMHGP